MSFAPDTDALLPLQQGMLLHLFANPESGIDIQQCIVRVRAPLDMARFARAWQRVMDRHEGLRTSFRLQGSDCVQVVAREAQVVTSLVDWRHLTLATRDAAFERFLSEDRTRPFDLTRCPLWRVTVFDCANEGFRFVFTKPHAILDAQSVFIILREVFDFYDRASDGDDADNLAPAGTFREYMAWHKRRDTAAAESCWRTVFKGFESPASLLVAKPIDPPAAPAMGQCNYEHVIDAAIGERIRNVAAREKLPLSAVVKATWAVLLSRISGTNDVVFGEVRSGRRKDVPNMQGMVGMFVATVPARALVSPTESFRELVLRLRESQQAVRDHEHTPLVDIQRWCGLPPGTALFDTALVFDHLSVDAIMKRDGGAWLNREVGYRERTSVPITLNVRAEPDLLVKISWDRSRFPDRFMRRLPHYFQTLLEGFAANPDVPIVQLDMLPADERSRLLAGWNDTARPFDALTTLPRAFAERVRRHPDRTAIVFGRTRLTYRQLERKANCLAARMQACGVGKGSLVGICVDRSIEMLSAMLAAMKAGAGYVPLDPSLPDERLQFMATDARPHLVAVSAAHAERFTSAGTTTLCVDESSDALASPEDPYLTTVESEADDLAYVIYTSGSTGRPKGVMVTHRNVANCFAGMDDVLSSQPGGTWLAVTSISFDISVIELFWTLTRGFTVVICKDSADAPEITRLLQSGGISHFQCTPSLARMLAADPVTREALRDLPVIMLGGEALPEDLLRQLRGRHRQNVINMYGPTETTIWSTAAHVRDDICIGRPIANTRLYVLDADRVPVPTGIPGELYIGGEGVAKGYLNRARLTAERFLPDPWSSEAGARMYRTGDLVRYREDGTLDYLGRLDNQVKILGHRIELGEIENALQGLWQVGSAAVVARNVRAEEKCLVAYVTLAPGCASVDSMTLREELRKTLPEYEIPSAFFVLEQMPLTPNLKIDRKALPELEREAQVRPRAEVVLPRNDMECKLAQLWQEALGFESISVTDSFFFLGGDSLRAVQVILGVRARMGIEVSANTLYQYPTIEAFAAHLMGYNGNVPDAWAVWERHGEESTAPALIGLHGVDDIFVPLAARIGLPMHTLTSRVGFDGSVPPYHPCTCVEEMAERYLAALRIRQPHGPYALMGFCLGGLITLEVAARLTEAGETVAFLGLFNAPPPKAPEESSAERVARHWSAVSSLGLATKCSYVLTRLANQVRNTGASSWRRLRKFHERVRVALRNPAADDAADAPQRLVHDIAQFGLQMVKNYSHRSYSGRIHLFHGGHWPRDYVERWSAVAGEGAAGFLLPGGHIDMMAEPNIREVAARLIECLPEATKRRQSETAEVLRLNGSGRVAAERVAAR